MNLNYEFDTIRYWAESKNLYADGDLKTQVLKLQEETGELAKAVIEKDDIKIWDSIGDCVIVLTSIAKFSGITIEKCINEAFEQIKNREGEMFNGTFVKNKL